MKAKAGIQDEPVRLISEDEETHLPDSIKAQQPWIMRLLRRSINRLFSPAGLTVTIGVLLILALTGISSTSYLDTARDIDSNGISKKDVYADSRIEVTDK